MKFYQHLRAELKLPKAKLDLLPHSYQILGKVLLIKLDKKLYRDRKLIGKKILEILPYVKSVLLIKQITTKKRIPQTEVIAGSRNTETIHKEHGFLYCLDPQKIMFSKGNKFEKLRLLKKIKKGDIVVDMFAGIGYWSIALAKKARVYAIDINPVSIKYLKKNAELNNVSLRIFKGDCRDITGIKADKIIMGYFGTKKFFSHALKLTKKGGMIFYHDLVAEDAVGKTKKELIAIAKKTKKKIKFISIKKVKSYAPGINHYVFDIKII